MIALALILGATTGNCLMHGCIKKDWRRAAITSAINAVLLLAFVGVASLCGVSFQ